jgi:outer membrane biosynthesis protein TonB
MLFVYILFILIIIFSLYQYIDNSEWEEFRANNFKAIFENRNKRYGAYQTRNRQSSILMYVTLAAVLVGIIAVYAKVIVDNYEGLNSMTFSEVSDTTQFTLSNQNVQETPPSQFNYAGENGDGLPQAKDGGERREDNPETTENSSEPQTAPEKTKPKTPEENILDFEKEQFANAGGAEERKNIEAEINKRKKEREEREKKKQQQKTEGGNGGNIGSNTGTQGKTLAEWNMNGRQPHQKNPDYIKIPGYMCGKGVNEKIVVKVKVNSNGDVYWAQSQAPDGANACCVEQAISYAKKSRFDFSQKPIEEGTITYYFKSQ